MSDYTFKLAMFTTELRLDPPDLKPADLPVPDHLGLPVSDTLDYCPSP